MNELPRAKFVIVKTERVQNYRHYDETVTPCQCLPDGFRVRLIAETDDEPSYAGRLAALIEHESFQPVPSFTPYPELVCNCGDDGCATPTIVESSP